MKMYHGELRWLVDILGFGLEEIPVLFQVLRFFLDSHQLLLFFTIHWIGETRYRSCSSLGGSVKIQTFFRLRHLVECYFKADFILIEG